MRRYVIRELCGLAFVLWAFCALIVALFVVGGLASHSVPAGIFGAGYLLVGALLFKGSRTSSKVFLPRVAALKREGFRPELELIGSDDYIGLSRPQNKAVFLKWFDDKRIELALSDIASVKVLEQNKRTYLQIYTRRLDMPRIGVRVPAGQLDDWMARLDIVLNEPA